jgi:hypothetical protein
MQLLRSGFDYEPITVVVLVVGIVAIATLALGFGY